MCERISGSVEVKDLFSKTVVGSMPYIITLVI
jgi:hypothetical protein